MKVRFVILVLFLFFITSCRYYKEYDKESFPTYAWNAGQEITFYPTIDDINASYELTLGIRHLFGFQPSRIGVRVKSISPSGKVVTKIYDFQIRDASMEYIGSCGGDLCDLETIVDEQVRFEEAGEYTYVITHTENTDKIPGVMEFGLILDKND